MLRGSYSVSNLLTSALKQRPSVWHHQHCLQLGTSVPRKATMVACSSWHILPGTRKEELSLDFTLPTGQTFRWTRIVQAPEPTFEGVVGQRAVRDASSSACNALA